MRSRSMLGLCLALLAAFGAAEMARAEDTVADCDVPASLLETASSLPKVMAAVKAGKPLDVLVIGSRSSTIGADGGSAYPARMQAALKDKLSQLTVNVSVEIQAKRTADEVASSLVKLMETKKPTLVIWQTGTVDAMKSIDTDQFSAALDHGIAIARSVGADVVLINAQYSPRTESMIALGIYAENMRWVALQQEVPLFDRFSIMKLWADLGTFDLYSATKKLDIAERVHDCIGRLLADLVIEAAKPDEPHAESGR